MFKHILIPTDGSPLSRAAAAAGIELAGKLGARVTGLFAAPAPTPIVYRALIPVGYMTPDEHADLIRRAAKRYLETIAAEARRAGVKCETVSVTDEYPAHAILEMARKRRCDLIFMASHGRRGITDALLGSETQKVLHESRIPVLVYRGRQRG
ncbi:MAG TPA: universal stress protein [Burkholderiales bacterium]|nr:universal stress protein [Burkholderiales bacterium]